MEVCVCVYLCVSKEGEETLTGPAVWVEDEAVVTGAGIRAGDVGTQLLAVTIATFINIWPKRKRQSGYELYHIRLYSVGKLI